MISTETLDRYSIPFAVKGVDFNIGITDVVMDKNSERGDIYIDDFIIGNIYTEDGTPVVGRHYRRLVDLLYDSDDFYGEVFDREMKYQEELAVERALLMREGGDR